MILPGSPIEAVHVAPPARAKADRASGAPELFEQALTQEHAAPRQAKAKPPEPPAKDRQPRNLDARSAEPVRGRDAAGAPTRSPGDEEPAATTTEPITPAKEQLSADPPSEHVATETAERAAGEVIAAAAVSAVLEALPVVVSGPAQPAAESAPAVPTPLADVGDKSATGEARQFTVPIVPRILSSLGASPAQASAQPLDAVATPVAEAPSPAATSSDAVQQQSAPPPTPGPQAAATAAMEPASASSPALMAIALPVTAATDTAAVAPASEPTVTVTARATAGSADGAPRGADEALNTARLARGLQSAVSQRGGSITLRLTPPEMGTVRIQMQVTAARVAVQFHAETVQGQALLTQQLGQLRTTLESHGLQVDRITVQPMQPGQTSSHAPTSQQQQDSASHHDARADDGRSRGSFDRRQDAPRDDRRQASQFDFQQLFEQGTER